MLLQQQKQINLWGDFMSYYEQFENLKKKINVDESKLTKSFATQVNMTDEESSGCFYIANVDGPLSVEPYDYHDYTSMITASSQAFSDILSGELDPVKAFLSGDIAIEGDIEDIKMLAGAIVKPVRRRTAKSTDADSEITEKKATRKKKITES